MPPSVNFGVSKQKKSTKRKRNKIKRERNKERRLSGPTSVLTFCVVVLFDSVSFFVSADGRISPPHKKKRKKKRGETGTPWNAHRSNPFPMERPITHFLSAHFESSLPSF